MTMFLKYQPVPVASAIKKNLCEAVKSLFDVTEEASWSCWGRGHLALRDAVRGGKKEHGRDGGVYKSLADSGTERVSGTKRRSADSSGVSGRLWGEQTWSGAWRSGAWALLWTQRRGFGMTGPGQGRYKSASWKTPEVSRMEVVMVRRCLAVWKRWRKETSCWGGDSQQALDTGGERQGAEDDLGHWRGGDVFH